MPLPILAGENEMDIHRIVTQGEPINEVIVTEGNEFNLILELYDDQGNAFTDGLGAGIILMMSDGSYLRWTGDVVSISGGEATIAIDETVTADPGDYICKLRMYDDGATPDSYLTIGEFRLLVKEAT
jgi:hypothetical protein